MSSSRGLVATAALLALAGGCKRTPQCFGEPTRDDLMRFQELARDGKYPCPEHAHPSIEVHAAGVTLNGRLVVPGGQLPSEKPRKITPLFAELKQNRETWKQVNPGKDFEPEVTLKIDGGIDYVAAVSVLMTTAFAGYPYFHLSSGGISADFAYAVPGPPRPDEEKPPDTFVIQKMPDGSYTAWRKQGSITVQEWDQRDLDGVVRSIGESVPPSGAAPVREVGLAMRGEFAVTATMIRRILDLPAFQARPPAIRFLIQS